jgi:hypothetical protein
MMQAVLDDDERDGDGGEGVRRQGKGWREERLAGERDW